MNATTCFRCWNSLNPILLKALLIFVNSNQDLKVLHLFSGISVVFLIIYLSWSPVLHDFIEALQEKSKKYARNIPTFEGVNLTLVEKINHTSTSLTNCVKTKKKRDHAETRGSRSIDFIDSFSPRSNFQSIVSNQGPATQRILDIPVFVPAPPITPPFIITKNASCRRFALDVDVQKLLSGVFGKKVGLVNG